LGGSVLNIGIRGLENLVSRGGGIAEEAKRLAGAVDVILNLSHDVIDSWYKARKAKPENDTGDKQQAPNSIEEQWSMEEQLWLAQACPAAKAIGRRNRKLTNEALAEEMNMSDSTLKGRKKSFAGSWSKVEAAYLEGVQEYSAEQMAKNRLITDKKQANPG
jgi:hypothetical protein